MAVLTPASSALLTLTVPHCVLPDYTSFGLVSLALDRRLRLYATHLSAYSHGHGSRLPPRKQSLWPNAESLSSFIVSFLTISYLLLVERAYKEQYSCSTAYTGTLRPSSYLYHKAHPIDLCAQSNGVSAGATTLDSRDL